MIKEYKQVYSNGAVKSFINLMEYSNGVLNYPDCLVCQGKSKYCDDCFTRFENDNNPETLSIIRKQEIRNRIKEIIKETKQVLKQDKIKINVRGKLSDKQFKYAENFNINHPLAIEYRKLLKEFWSIAPVVKDKITLIRDDFSKLSRIDSISIHSYHTQGYGQQKYTLGTLQWKQYLLDKNGYNPIIIKDNYQYILYCDNISKERLKSILNSWTLSQLCQWFWNRGINPRVYYPFLDYKPEFDYGYDRNI